MALTIAGLDGTGTGKQILAKLDTRIIAVIDEFKRSPIWDAISDPTSPIELIRSIIREIYWEVHCYQPATTRSGFAMIGRTAPDEMKVMRTLLLHKWDEVEHRVWALDGYKSLGGDLSRIGSEIRSTSPGAFAVAAIWERISEKLHPLAYLGAEYLFEDLTAHLTQMAATVLKGRSLSSAGMRFIVDHATEDVKHSNLMKMLITEVGNRRPELESEILFSFDCFHQVYPIPLWLGSYARALVISDAFPAQ